MAADDLIPSTRTTGHNSKSLSLYGNLSIVERTGKRHWIQHAELSVYSLEIPAAVKKSHTEMMASMT